MRKRMLPNLFLIALLIYPLSLSAQDTNQAAPSPDFDGDGMVGIPDFLLFVDRFGSMRGDEKYEAKYDLDGDGMIGIPDFLIFVDNFGKEIPPSDNGDDEEMVSIPDANLRAVVEDSLSKASGAPITRAEMASLTRLEAPDKTISDLTGLEFAANLTWLSLARNSVSDISALSNLTSLTQLYLQGNDLSDVPALSNLTALTTLSLQSNRISDVSALSNLTALTRFFILIASQTFLRCLN